MRKLQKTACLVAAFGSAPLIVHAEDQPAGYNGGDTRLDDYWYGNWVSEWLQEHADEQNTAREEWNEAVCGGKTPVIRGVSVNAKRLWDNAALCSDSVQVELGGQHSIASWMDGQWAWAENHTDYYVDCGAHKVALGIAQLEYAGGDLGLKSGVSGPLLCKDLPANRLNYDCKAIELDDVADGEVAPDAQEDPSEPDWAVGYSKLTCGRGRYMRGYAARWTTAGSIFDPGGGQATVAILCCSAD